MRPLNQRDILPDVHEKLFFFVFSAQMLASMSQIAMLRSWPCILLLLIINWVDGLKLFYNRGSGILYLALVSTASKLQSTIKNTNAVY